jgi:hypothetical protein
MQIKWKKFKQSFLWKGVKKMKDKGFKICMGFYILMFLIDLGTTLLNGDMVKYLEANPLYPYGGLWTISILNIIIMGLFYYFYNKAKKPSLRFTLIWGMSMIIITRIVVAYNNYQIYLNPPTLEVAKSLTYEAKTQALMKMNLALNLLPMLNAFLAFFFWEKDHIIEIKK